MEHIATRLSLSQKEMLLNDAVLVKKFGPNLEAWSEDVIRCVLTRRHDFAWLDVTPEAVDLELYKESHAVCRELGFLPAFRGRISLHVFMTEPFHAPAIRALRNHFHREIHPIGTTALAFDRTVSWIEQLVSADAQTDKKYDIPVIHNEPISWDFTPEESKFPERLLTDAYFRKTSDVYLNTYADRLDVIFKIAGIGVTMPPLDPMHTSKFLQNIKAMMNMKPRETRGYRDGSASLKMPDGNTINFRAVAQKIHKGESMTIRLLDKGGLLSKVGTLPFPPRENAIFRLLLNQKQGLILVCGPTGSGKTTTLWLGLLLLNASEKKIITIEQPIEYDFDRIVQIPVRSEDSDDTDKELPENFELAVRSCMRASPDVMLVGEIRDRETAGAAIEASLSGHLILSTIHTPDACGAIPRLLDKGVSPLNIQQSLLAVVAQRLAPRLCKNCRIPVKLSPAQIAHFKHHNIDPIPEQIFEHSGCPTCGGSGHNGRVPVFEMFVPDEEMSSLISDDPKSLTEIRKLWIERGGVPLGKYAMLLCAQGEVSYAQASALDAGFKNTVVGQNR